jgi:hypothetical protein
MNWRVKVLAIGGVLGVLIGLASALLYVRTIEQAGGGDAANTKLPAVQTSDGLRIFISVIMLVRSIAGLAEHDAG